MSLITSYINRNFRHAPGRATPWKTFWEGFQGSLSADESLEWTQTRLRHELKRLGFPVGQGSGNFSHVGNLKPVGSVRRYVQVGSKIRLA